MRRWMCRLMVIFALVGCSGSQLSTTVPKAGSSGDAVVTLIDGTAKTGGTVPELQWTFNGTEHKLSEYRGKAVLINFWQTTCTPCKTEMPDFQHLSDERSDVLVLSINVGERSELITAFAAQYGLSYPLLPDPDRKVSQAFGVTQILPMTFFITPDGIIKRIQIGAMTRSQMDLLIQELNTPS